jgi:hypothetical protein
MKTRLKLKRDPFKEQPGFFTYYEIGAAVAQQLPAHCSYSKVGKAFGVSKRRAYTEAVVALGKVCYALRRLRDCRIKESAPR